MQTTRAWFPTGTQMFQMISAVVSLRFFLRPEIKGNTSAGLHKLVLDPRHWQSASLSSQQQGPWLNPPASLSRHRGSPAAVAHAAQNAWMTLDV